MAAPQLACVLLVETELKGWQKTLHKIFVGIEGLAFSIDAPDWWTHGEGANPMMFTKKLMFLRGEVDPVVFIKKLFKAKIYAMLYRIDYGHEENPQGIRKPNNHFLRRERRERRKVDSSSGPVIGRRVSVRAVTGAPKATVNSARSSLCRRPLPPPPCLSSGRRSSMALLFLGSVSSVDAGSGPREVKPTLSSAFVGQDYGGEGAPCLASASIGGDDVGGRSKLDQVSVLWGIRVFIDGWLPVLMRSVGDVDAAACVRATAKPRGFGFLFGGL
ncbi:hypothetical protein F2Q69_00046267 [Brassica cretica]|uniref:Uncharacterized protein n=1 Tax=Brassica cretica TaxID=69181 RepID=A0A8S9PRA5_BRACR|nr:hypothetical protein F2Q69_00046267 [Brassica cretica]